MDLELLKRFYIVAQEGTVWRAADRIHVVQSAVTRSINLFEHQMKTRLFERTPKGMQLTPQGERLFVFAKRIFEETDNFEKIFHEKEDEIEGEIKIVTTPFIGAEWLVPTLKNFLEKHPNIKINIFLTSENIEATEGDIAICTMIPHQPHLTHHYLFTTYIRLFASPSYLKKFGTPQTVDDLNNHRLITYKDNYYSPYGSTNWILKVGNKENVRPRESYFKINSLHGMINAALQGYGIVELPDHFPVLRTEFTEVLPDIYGPKIDIYFIFPESRQKSKKINLLLKYLLKGTK